jgi:hypothetical protein
MFVRGVRKRKPNFLIAGAEHAGKLAVSRTPQQHQKEEVETASDKFVVSKFVIGSPLNPKPSSFYGSAHSF